jgi:phosphoserine phosphatase RsbU/P
MAADGQDRDSAEDLFENAPCGYLSTLLDGTIVMVNSTFEQWTGHPREQLLAGRRFQELLSPGGQIYHETHYAPLLQMQGWVREIAVEIVRADGSRLPALVNSTVHDRGPGQPQIVRTMVFDATDRRRYEEELLRAQRREREIAQQLQRSLLAGTPPQAPGLEIEVFYEPAVAGLEVGGDWYDAFWLEEGRTVALVVGDVVGRGIGAAATMGQLRSAVRALASTGVRPGALLDALDTYSRRHGVGRNTTLIYAELDLTAGALRFACAGHPPPVLVQAGEEPCLVWDGRSAPLDVSVPPGGPRPEASRSLTPGSSIVLYTDGLVERRSQSITDTLDELVEQVGRHRDNAAATLVGAVVEALDQATHADDVCLLVARLGALAQPE